MPPTSSHSLPRRTFLGTAAAATSFAQTAPKRPNIIYIHSHDTGRYLEPYGHAVPAPNLQRLATQGVLFRQAFNAGPTCSPSRASLLTGMCPHSNGMFGLAHRGFILNDYKQHILHTLRPAGYYSALFGVQHIASNPGTIGYDKFEVFPGNHVEPVSAAAAKFLQASPKTPFFLDIGFQETHREFR
jgi:arylsulfatase A-like enzyme